LTTLLSIENLNVSYFKNPVLHNINLEVFEGETLGLIGSSGSGKTTIALAIMGLLPKEAKVKGAIKYLGKNLLSLKEKGINKIRGSEISIIFQEPLSALDPLFSISKQIEETITTYSTLSKKGAEKRAEELLKRVGISETRRDEYPHSFSGGMAQRIMIAQAISGNPRLLIADEPTSSLDTTIQVQILNLLQGLKDELGMSILLITHDLGVIAQMADRVCVIYKGEIVESASCIEIFDNPQHPYTKALMESMFK